ncbi:MAG: alpha/beta hydrolase [Gammaproteobacteria bacterium]
MLRSCFVLTALLLFALPFSAQSAQTDALITVTQATRWENPKPDALIHYGADPNQYGELRLPKGKGPYPVAIVVHGGGWEAQYGIQYVGRFAKALADSGIATWSLEYRRVGNPGGGWPGTFQDVAQGADFLRTLAPKYNLDLTRVIAIGHSAGGQLALWLAARPKISRNPELMSKDPLRLKGVMGIAPVNDLVHWYPHPVLKVCDGKGRCEQTIRTLVGGSPEERPERYAELSPRLMLPLGIPTVVVLGGQDIWSKDEYYEAAQAAHEQVRLMSFADAGHFEIIDPQSAPWPQVSAAATELVGGATSPHKVMSEDEYMAIRPVAADHRIPYGKDPLQFGDLYLPKAGGKHPLVVLVHGGCWMSRYPLDQLGQFARAINAEGFAVWNLEYRRVGNGGGWPVTWQDVAQGTDFARELASRYPLDLSRVVIVGHSAGGHLAAWLASRARVPAGSDISSSNPLRPIGAVVIAGVPDMRAAVEGDLRKGLAECTEATREIMGGRPAQVPDHYRAGSPIELLPTGVPQWNLVGSEDKPLRIEQLRRYVAAAKAAGDPAQLTVVEGAGHFEMTDSTGPYWHYTHDAIVNAMKRR